jgi:hypothetical protein
MPRLIGKYFTTCSAERRAEPFGEFTAKDTS